MLNCFTADEMRRLWHTSSCTHTGESCFPNFQGGFSRVSPYEMFQPLSSFSMRHRPASADSEGIRRRRPRKYLPTVGASSARPTRARRQHRRTRRLRRMRTRPWPRLAHARRAALAAPTRTPTCQLQRPRKTRSNVPPGLSSSHCQKQKENKNKNIFQENKNASSRHPVQSPSASAQPEIRAAFSAGQWITHWCPVLQPFPSRRDPLRATHAVGARGGKIPHISTIAKFAAHDLSLNFITQQ